MKVITKRNLMVDGKIIENGTVVDINTTLAFSLEKNGVVQILDEPKKEVEKPSKKKRNEDDE